MDPLPTVGSTSLDYCHFVIMIAVVAANGKMNTKIFFRKLHHFDRALSHLLIQQLDIMLSSLEYTTANN